MIARREIAWPLLLLALLVLVGLYFVRVVLVVGFPYQLEYGEGPVLDWTRMVARGELPYRPIDARPWSFSVYTPVYMLASAPLLRLLPDFPWLGGRVLTIGAALLLAYLLVRYVLVRDPTAKRTALATGALWLVSPWVVDWSVLYRVDIFGLLWSAGGILFVDRAIRGMDRRWLISGALAMVVGVFTKQSLVAAPIAALLFLVVRRRRWLPWLIAPGAIGGLLGIGLLYGLAGMVAFDNLVAANANPYLVPQLLRQQAGFWSLVAPLALLVVGALVARRAGDQALMVTYLVTSALLTVTVGKVGAADNYFLEPLWALLAVAGPILARLQRTGGWNARLVVGLLAIQLFLFSTRAGGLQPGFLDRLLEAEREGSEAILTRLDGIPEGLPIWSEHMGVLAQHERAVDIHSFVYTQLAAQGLWDEYEMVASLTSGEAPLLVQSWDAPVNRIGRERWSPAMHDAAEVGYARGANVGRWALRHPQPVPLLATPIPLSEDFEVAGWLLLACTTEGCARAEPPQSLASVETVEVHLLLRSHREFGEQLSVSLQLFDPSGERVAQHDTIFRGGLPDPWIAGSLLRHEQTLELPEASRPGPYPILVSVYRTADASPLGAFRIDGLKLEGAAPTPPDLPLDVRFGSRLRLVGIDPPPPTLAVGETLRLRAVWEARRPAETGLTTFLHLLAPDGTIAAQHDYAPDYGPTLWSEGERVALGYEIPLPETLAPGDYSLLLGWYSSDTIERLEIPPPDGPADALRLDPITIR